MFDDLLDPATCGEITRAQMVTAIRQYHRLHATTAARTWAFVAMLLRDHEDTAAAEDRQHWAHDGWAAARDDIGPALRLSPRRASTQMKIAEALALRLPETAALLEHGMISAAVATTIVYRTEYVAPHAHAAVDAEIAERAGGFNTLSDAELDVAIDAVIEERDPDAVRRFREAAKHCDVQVGKRDDATGTKSLYGRILHADADLSVRVLNAYADTVCNNDPRSRGELRSAAYGAVFRGHDRLICRCATPDCPAATIPSKVGSVMVHILAEQATLEAALAQVAALQNRQPANPTDPAPTVDLEALARDFDNHTTTTGEDDDDEPPWAHWTSTTSEDPSPDPGDTDASDMAADDDAGPEPSAPQDDSSEPLPDADPDDPDDNGDDEDPPRATPAPTPGPEDPDRGGDAAVPEPNTDPEPSAAQTDSSEPTPLGGDAADTPAASTGEPQGSAQPSNAVSADHAEPAAAPIRPAVTLAGGIIPTALLAELIHTGATVKALPLPTAEPKAGYAFTGALREFIQCRDMRCRFPGCNRRAEYADIDHTLPHGDGGPTHPSNGKLLCREHHLAKTFYTGPDGWTDEQLPTGEVIWTAPTGHQYLTEPSTWLIFPDWNPETAKLPPPPKRKTRRTTTPGPTMPKRKRTREQDRQQHIKTERAYNATQRALEQEHGRSRPPPAGW